MLSTETTLTSWRLMNSVPISGVGDAAVAQPDRPVAHEGAGREEVGRAVAGQPPALDDAIHQAANSRRTWSVCWPSSGTSPSCSGSPS